LVRQARRVERSPIPADEVLDTRLEIRWIEKMCVAREISGGHRQRATKRDAKLKMRG
jgi:hypothetical protein